MPLSNISLIFMSTCFGFVFVFLLAICLSSNKKNRNLSFYKKNNRRHIAESPASGEYATIGPQVPERPDNLPSLSPPKDSLDGNTPEPTTQNTLLKKDPLYVEPTFTPKRNLLKQVPGSTIANTEDVAPTLELQNNTAYMVFEENENHTTGSGFPDGHAIVNLGNAPIPTTSSLYLNADNPVMKDEQVRLQTFISPNSTWPKGVVYSNVQKFVDAGLYYTGEGDCVKCWCCGGNLKCWEEGDDPWDEHAKWFSICNYIKQRGKRNTYEHIV